MIETEALVIDGAAGYIVRTPNGVLRVLQLLTPSGQILNVALDDPNVATAIRWALDQLTLAELETGEAMRDLGLYQQG